MENYPKLEKVGDDYNTKGEMVPPNLTQPNKATAWSETALNDKQNTLLL